MQDTCLLADIGATNARLALVRSGERPKAAINVRCADYEDLGSALLAHLQVEAAEAIPRRAALAVAAPVAGDLVSLTNHPWRFSISHLQRQLGLEQLIVINDMAAVAWSLPHLASDEVRKLGGGEGAPDGSKVVIGPGTGLGVAALIRTETAWHAVSGEGGHVDFAPADEEEEALLRALRGSWSHVSLERFLSGPGLVAICQALAELAGCSDEEKAVLVDPAQIVGRARDGECPLAIAAVRQFCAILGSSCGNLALTFGASGGVYVAGGIVPKMAAAFDSAVFRQRFEAKGRLASYLAPIPTVVIVTPYSALLGLSRLIDPDGRV